MTSPSSSTTRRRHASSPMATDAQIADLYALLGVQPDFAKERAKVNELLAARLHARLNRDFVAADRMRDTLRREHGVECFDQEREWRCIHPPGSRRRRQGQPRVQC